jgi:alpha-beta hydrolase superfamily lysophospholipase
MNRRSWRLAGGLVLGLLLLGCIGAWLFAGMLISSANHAVHMPADFPAERVSIPGPGREVAANYRDLGGDSPIVLMAHGFRGDRVSLVARARRLVAAGYSVLLIDLQAHGETPGERITLGWREADDVRAARDWLRARRGTRKLAFVGVSLGGAAVLLGPQPAGFDAVVLEAVYPRVTRAIENRISIRLPAVSAALAPFLTVQLEPRVGASAEELEPVRHIGKLGAPVLVVGGSRDEQTSAEETRELFAAAIEPRALWMVEGAGHQDFSRYDPAGYDAHVIAFLDQHLRAPAGARR